MERVFDNVIGAVGNTPIVRLNAVSNKLKATIYAKLEYLNPGGSIKDRVAFQIIEDAEAEGLLQPGGTVIEATSGNTGMGLAMAAAIKGYKTIFVMPDKMSEEKIQALRAFDSKVVLTPTSVEPEDPRSYYSVSRKLVADTPNSFYANQYHNPSNPKAHYLKTGPEIWQQFPQIDALVVGAGTGGTLSGTAKYLKEQNPNIQVVAVDPVGSIYYDFFHTGKMTEAHSYKVEGFGEDFLPTTMDFSVMDDCVRVTDKDCFLMTRRLVREEGLFAGGSSGGAVAGALAWAAKQDKEMNILVILPDAASKYLSKIFNDDWMRENRYLGPDQGFGTVADVLGDNIGKVVTLNSNDNVRKAVAVLKEHGYSQVPVLDNKGKIMGIVREVDLLSALLSAEGAGEIPIKMSISDRYAVVETNNSASLLSQLFNQKRIILVMEHKKLVGVLTQIDYIDYISEHVG